MCGIVVWGRRHGAVDGRRLGDAVLTLRHRGPDQQRMLLVDTGAACLGSSITVDEGRSGPAGRAERAAIGLGHARLSIIDLDRRSDQPMVSPDGRHAVVFNGEIYNFRELRPELAALGWRFRTQGDTEVLLAALATWGAEATRRFNGMWAFAFFDARERSILLSRDRYGKKPLYFLLDDDDFVVASEYKAIFAVVGEARRRPNERFIEHFLQTGRWQPATYEASAYEGVRALPPGSSGIYRWDRHDLSVSPNNVLRDFLTAPEATAAAVARDVADAVALRLVADVPVGVLVSGGVDSSVVAAHAAGVHPAAWYTGITDAGRDLGHARTLARSLGVTLVEVDVRPRPGTLLETIAGMTALYEIPVWLNGNSIAMYQMYRAMAADGIRVALDGTGGDEVFGGYFSKFARNMVAGLVADGRRLEAASFIASCWWHRHCDVRPLWRMLIDGAAGIAGLVEAQVTFIESGNLPHWLTMNDLNAMGHSIEARSPLLDYRLAQYVRLSPRDKFRHGFNKYLLRQSLPERVPREIRWRRDKQGFRWRLADALPPIRDRVLDAVQSSSYLRDRHPAAVRRLHEGGEPHPLRLYAVAEFERSNAERRSQGAVEP